MTAELTIYRQTKDSVIKLYCEDCKPQGSSKGTLVVSGWDHFCAGCGLDFKDIAVQQAEKPVKYIRFNAGNLSRPTWVHVASSNPFVLKPGRFGRWSTTACGKEYEADDYTVIKNEQEQVKYLCKKCAQAKHIEHQR